MDFAKTRCPLCLRFFCCESHRVDHQVKNHSEVSKKHSNDFLLKVFQRKAEAILVQSRKRKGNINESKKVLKDLVNNDKKEYDLKLPRMIEQKAASKRLYNEIDKRILSTSTRVLSETRKILIPVHRLKTDSKLKDFTEEKTSSLCDVEVMKTSTPVMDNLPNTATITPQMKWNSIISTSSINSYHTPSDTVQTDEQYSIRSQQSKVSIVTPLRSIISKTSKYEYNPSPGQGNKCRRVTFSFSSQVSSTNSSPLESVQEVEDKSESDKVGAVNSSNSLELTKGKDFYKPIENRYTVESKELISSSTGAEVFFERNCDSQTIDERNENRYYLESRNFIFESAHLSSCMEAKEIDVFKERTQTFEDSASMNNTGFFSCMTNIFCSAVHNIPSIVTWRYDSKDCLNNSSRHNKSKRSRSPEPKNSQLDVALVQSPVHKRPCYPCDLRRNPIKARKPISQSCP